MLAPKHKKDQVKKVLMFNFIDFFLYKYLNLYKIKKWIENSVKGELKIV